MRRNTLVWIAAATLALSILVTNALGQSAQTTTAHQLQLKNPPTIVHGPASKAARKAIIAAGANSQLPVWNYEVVSSRDGGLYQGVIVGHKPTLTGSGAAASVPTQIVPIVLNFQTIGTAVDLNTGLITTASGSATSDPTAADTACFTGTNNVPLALMTQSPILKNADFNFGGTDVGYTDYPFLEAIT